MVKKSKNLYSYFNGTCDPSKEGNEGIWFDEEDPTSLNYKPECCSDMYLDVANGEFEKMFQNFNMKSSSASHFFEKNDTDFQYDQENALYDEVYDFDGSEFVEVDLQQ